MYQGNEKKNFFDHQTVYISICDATIKLVLYFKGVKIFYKLFVKCNVHKQHKKLTNVTQEENFLFPI